MLTVFLRYRNQAALLRVPRSSLFSGVILKLESIVSFVRACATSGRVSERISSAGTLPLARASIDCTKLFLQRRIGQILVSWVLNALLGCSNSFRRDETNSPMDNQRRLMRDLSNDLVEALKDEHEAWIAVFNRGATRG